MVIGQKQRNCFDLYPIRYNIILNMVRLYLFGYNYAAVS